MKYIIQKTGLLTSLLLFPILLSAQDLAEPVAEKMLFSDLMSIILTASVVLVGVTAMFAVYKTLDLMVRMRELKIYEEHGLQDYLAEKKANEGSWWHRFSKSMTAAVPIEKEGEILLDHDYDGIRELDNNLPPWWLYGFYLTIVIAVVYMLYFHVLPYGKSSEEEYLAQMEQAEKDVEAYLARQANLVDETNVSLLTDEESLAGGKEIFTTLCAACHLDHGGGASNSVGPNLTDKYGLHGGSIVDVFTTIKYGVPEKGMISWRTQIRPADMQKVASYVLSLQGTDPPGAKEAQGELYEPESSIVESEKYTGAEAAATEEM